MPLAVEASTLMPTSLGYVRADRLQPGDTLYTHLGEPVRLSSITAPAEEPAVTINAIAGWDVYSQELVNVPVTVGLEQRIRSWTQQAATLSQPKMGMDGEYVPVAEKFRFSVIPDWWERVESLPLEVVAATIRNWWSQTYEHSIPVANTLKAPRAELSIEPYAYGLAYSNRPTWRDPQAPNMLYVHSKSRDWVLRHLEPAFPGLEVIHAPKRGVNWSRIWLPDDALPPIPLEYALASPDQRYALLDGLVDSFVVDASAAETSIVHGTVRIHLRERASADTVEQLIQSLGWDVRFGARRKFKEWDSYGRGEVEWWRMNLRPNRRLGRAPILRRRQLGHFSHRTTRALTIESVRYVGNRDIVRLCVDAPSLAVGRRNLSMDAG